MEMRLNHGFVLDLFSDTRNVKKQVLTERFYKPFWATFYEHSTSSFTLFR